MKNYQRGAADERRDILAKLRRKRRDVPDTDQYTRTVLYDLICWVQERRERYDKRADGGSLIALGRSSTAPVPSVSAREIAEGTGLALSTFYRSLHLLEERGIISSRKTRI